MSSTLSTFPSPNPRAELRVNGALITGLLCCLAVAGSCLAQQDFSKVEMKETRLTDSVYMVEGAGGNLGVSVGGDGILLIDDQFAPLVEKIRNKAVEISKTAGHPQDHVSYLINTHWHFDHTGGNEGFGLEAAIIAHDAVRSRMAKGAEQPRPVPPAPKVALPILTFKESVTLHWNGEDVDVIHFPSAHTDGDSVIFFRGSNVVHMGDHFFNGGTFPFIDLASGGSAVGMRDNVGKIVSMLPDDVKIIPGHGPLSTLEDLQATHAMLVDSADLVRRALAAGKSADDMKKEGLLGAYADEWSWGFVNADRFIDTLVASLGGK